ncbi:ribosomal protein L6e [Cooperia oncophora]
MTSSRLDRGLGEVRHRHQDEDVSDEKIPDHINDDYFRRKKLSGKKGENIFAAGKVEYQVTEQRKTDLKVTDKPILAAIKKNPEHKALFGYLGSRFMLGKRQYPHKMVF